MHVAYERQPVISRWSGTGRLRPGVLEIEGPLGSLPRHAHHSVQVAIAHQGMFVIEDRQGRRRRTDAAIVPVGQPHAFTADGARGVVAHVEPESALGAELIELVDEPSDVRSWQQAGRILVNGHSAYVEGRLRFPESAVRLRHPGVAAARTYLQAELDSRPVRLRDVAAAVHLSESRLSHLFAEELGITFRAYVRWLRLLRATGAVAQGCSLTEAAHLAGFTDSSHLTRTCRRTFGGPPSAFATIHWEILPI
ncbi:helix-turn-helix transcriptional regulator [Nocardia neocaledoniensis]|uniref:helix-turn-helix transcriptional regulator n=1 Tax=Nocardia neocaledoniensis TaxID=236511 RepID=UPI002458BE03|nr:helix-turn-helix transcriptional regulator [Nocardia neocaledoniensis]